MAYSELIEPASYILSSMCGCGFDAAVEYIENALFNTECSLKIFFDNIFNMMDINVRNYNVKGKKRDFWKKPKNVQMRLWLEMTPDEYAKFRELAKSEIIEERLIYQSDISSFWRETFKWQERHYERLDGCGIWCTSRKEEFYGIFTKQQRMEKDRKKLLSAELKEEDIFPIHIR